MPNVRKHAIFLDTQCQLYSLCLQAIAHKTPLDRMPMPIGDFISRRVYANRLKSQHSIHDRSSCRFVDIKQGKEVRVGHSFKVCSYTFLSSFLHESILDRTWKKRTTLCASRRRFTSKGSPTASSHLTTASVRTSRTCSRAGIYLGKIVASTWIPSKVCLCQLAFDPTY